MCSGGGLSPRVGRWSGWADTRQIANAEALKEFWDRLLKQGKTKKSCMGCNRGLQVDELPSLENHVSRTHIHG
jgi:hypothetical protein